MDNNENGIVPVDGQNGQNTANQQQNPPATEVKTEEPKGGLGSWLKKHWKGVSATGVGLATAVTTTILAYKRGKNAGQQIVPEYQPEISPLDPNVE